MVGESGLGSRFSVEKDWGAVLLPQAAVGRFSGQGPGTAQNRVSKLGAENVVILSKVLIY